MRYSPVLEMMSNQHAESENRSSIKDVFFFYRTQSKTHRNKKRNEKRYYDLVSTTQNCDGVSRKKCKKEYAIRCLWDAQQGWQVIQLDLRGRGPRGFFARGCARAISPPYYHLAPANPSLHVVATERTTQHMKRSSNPQSSLTVSPDWLLAQVALGAGFDRCWRSEILQLVRGVPGCHSCPSSVSHQPDPFSWSRHHLTTASTSIRPTTTTPNPWRLSRLRGRTGRNLDVIREVFTALLCFLSPFCSFSCT